MVYIFIQYVDVSPIRIAYFFMQCHVGLVNLATHLPDRQVELKTLFFFPELMIKVAKKSWVAHVRYQSGACEKMGAGEDI